MRTAVQQTPCFTIMFMCSHPRYYIYGHNFNLLASTAIFTCYNNCTGTNTNSYGLSSGKNHIVRDQTTTHTQTTCHQKQSRAPTDKKSHHSCCRHLSRNNHIPCVYAGLQVHQLVATALISKIEQAAQTKPNDTFHVCMSAIHIFDGVCSYCQSLLC